MKLETIKIGRIVNAHGIRGEVRVQPRDLDPNLLTRFDTFLLDGQPVKPSANHVHKSVVLMKFPGVDDMNAALNLKGKDLYIRRADAHLPEGTYFDDELLGLYDGVSLPDRADGYDGDLPDVITVFKGPHERCFGSRTELVAEIGKTVVHEIGHYFGIDDARLREMGY